MRHVVSLILFLLAICGTFLGMGLKSNLHAAIAISSIAAMVACVVAIDPYAIRFRSLVTICIACHLVSYPLSAIFALLDPVHAIYETRILEMTPDAMAACAVAMLGLWCGRLGYKTLLGGDVAKIKGFDVENVNSSCVYENRPQWVLVLMVVPYVAMLALNGAYFHSQIAGGEVWNNTSAAQLGYLGYIKMASMGGLALLARSYCLSPTRKNRIHIILAFSLGIILFAPSGSRDSLFGWAIPPVLIFLDHMTSIRRRIYFLLSVATLMIGMSSVMQLYRYTAISNGGRVGVDSTVLGKRVSEDLFDNFVTVNARRLSDYKGTAWYLYQVPGNKPHRLFENWSYAPQMLLPSMIRGDVPEIVLNESAELAYEDSGYGWRRRGGGQAPSMLIGDLYTRFSWVGIFVGFLLLGIFLTRIDAMLKNMTVCSQILWAGMVSICWKSLTQATSLELVIVFGRNMVIFYFIARILDYALFSTKKQRLLCESKG